MPKFKKRHRHCLQYNRNRTEAAENKKNEHNKLINEKEAEDEQVKHNNRNINPVVCMRCYIPFTRTTIDKHNNDCWLK